MDRETILLELNETLGRLGASVDALSVKLAQKVTAEAGKGLSSNDFDDTYKNRLDKLLNPPKRMTKLGEEYAVLYADRFAMIVLDN